MRIILLCLTFIFSTVTLSRADFTKTLNEGSSVSGVSAQTLSDSLATLAEAHRLVPVNSDSLRVSRIGTTSNPLMSLYSNGVRKARIDTTGDATFTSSVIGYRFITNALGKLSEPAIRYSDDLDTGLRWLTSTGNRLAITAKGADVAVFDSAGISLTGDIRLSKYPAQFLPLPLAPDTTVTSGKDSLSVLSLYKNSNLWLSREYLHAFGNGTMPSDTTRYGIGFIPFGTHPDSAFIQVRSNSGPGDSTGVQVIIRKAGRSAGDTTTVASYNVNVNTANTWETFSIPLYKNFTDEPFDLEYNIWCKGAYWIEMGRVYLK